MKYKVENLKLLRSFLDTVPDDKLYMPVFLKFNEDDESLSYDGYDSRPPQTAGKAEAIRHNCGTSACVCGWAALSGIPELKAPSGIDWREYGMYIAIHLGECDSDACEHDMLWSFLFSGDWSNSMKYAKRRLDYAIKYGDVPPDVRNYCWRENSDRYDDGLVTECADWG